MNSFRTFQEDDENDTQLFSAAEKHVLDHHPNPNRVGCPGPAVLRKFVETPGQVELSDLNGAHIMRCRECTQDLKELRRERENRQELGRKVTRLNWRWGTYAAAIVLAAFSVFFLVRRHDRGIEDTQSAMLPIATVANLRDDGVSRGLDEHNVHPVSLPAKLLDLNVQLPYYSASGTYRISITRERDTRSALVSSTAEARTDGPRTDVRVRLNLQNVTPGAYFLATELLDHQERSFYPLVLN